MALTESDSSDGVGSSDNNSNGEGDRQADTSSSSSSSYQEEEILWCGIPTSTLVLDCLLRWGEAAAASDAGLGSADGVWTAGPSVYCALTHRTLPSMEIRRLP